MSIQIFNAKSPACKCWLDNLLAQRRARHDGIEGTAAAIVEAVRERGDLALIELTQRYDNVDLRPDQLRIEAKELTRALRGLGREERAALELAARRIRAFHRHTVERSFSYRDRLGVRLGQIVRPLARVGIYVPGGAAAYPSTVLMNAIPAQVAGVKQIVMVSPLAPGQPATQVVLAAAALAGVSEVYRVGGAQAIAALAYGTQSIRPVNKIVGPGNAYVQAAKRLVYGATGIDMVAGPSEVLIIADDSARPDWIAGDLIAQAEHGSGDESAILITTSQELALAVDEALERGLSDLPRATAVRTALDRRGAAIVVDDVAAACVLANRIAPEHLELEVRQSARWVDHLEAAGAIFVGSASPAPFGDYLAGPNHVLPTGGWARFASPLGAYDFVKRTSIIQANAAAIAAIGPAVARLARLEGFEGHARAVEQRFRKGPKENDGAPKN
ncbi:MAG TPA: histidinol dehydrogenase [Candidatus Binataceae bacterium]|nr:histidinol dehydrogenase [Candidatus Binataceae bacterium]